MQDFFEQFEQIDPEIHGIRLPKFNLEEEDCLALGVDKNISSIDLFRLLVENGFKKRIDNEIKPSKEELQEYQDRLRYEMSVIEPTDFVDYLLMVWDVVNIARRNGIAVGPGRGSAASSLVLYCLEVTGIDPVKNGLYFERFLSAARTTPNIVNGIKYYSDAADIDLDIEDSQRGILIDLLKNKYDGRFCKICTHQTLQSRKCIKEVCKIVLGFSEEKSLEISSLVPSIFGKVQPLKKAILEVPELDAFCKKHPKVFKIALKLAELICGKGSHASAYIVSYDTLLNTIPCESGEGEMVTTYDMDYAQLNNIKLDLLGLKAVGIINEVCKSLNLDPSSFEINYENVFSHLQDVKHPYGLFQISGDCNLRVVNKVKPKNLDQLAAVTALARPGALQFVDRYASFVNNGTNEAVHPFFDEVLRPTAGLALYQESTMQMCEKIGLTKAEGEIIRKVIGKKLINKVKEWESKIFETVEKNGYDREIAEVLWKILEDSANYSFNRCLGKSTVVETENGYKMLFELKKGEKVKAFDVKKEEDHFVEILEIHENEVELFEIELQDGRKIEASLDHKFLCEDKKMRTLKEIIENNISILTD